MGAGTPNLGKLEPVELREIWDDEARSFTPWLARSENIQILSDTLDIELELDRTEVFVGSFRADIVCKSTDDSTVIIENQLEKTNHGHLGKLITYASGLNAKYVIWICSIALEEHRRAIDWLNETTIGTNYYLLEIKLWRIGNSPPAPQFTILSRKNPWAEAVSVITQPDNLSDTRKLHLEYWTALRDYMTERKTFLRLRTPRPSHWYSMAIGRSRFSLALIRNNNETKIGCELYIRGSEAKDAFALLEKQKTELEQILGKLDWQELPEGQDCRIIQYKNAPLNDKKDWPSQFSWLKDRAEAFYKTFSERIRNLDLEIG